jgi:hypothetical protein
VAYSVALDVVVLDQAVADPLVHRCVAYSVALDVVVLDQAVADSLVHRCVAYSVSLDVLVGGLGGVLVDVLVHGLLPLW